MEKRTILILLLIYLLHITTAAPLVENHSERESQEQTLIAQIVLEDVFKQVIEDSKTVEYSNSDKLYILKQLSIYLFGDDSQAEQALLGNKKRRHHKRFNRDIHNIAAAGEMNRLSFSQETRVLYELVHLLNRDRERTNGLGAVQALMLEQG